MDVVPGIAIKSGAVQSTAEYGVPWAAKIAPLEEKERGSGVEISPV